MLVYRGAANDIRQHAMQLRTRKEPNRWIYFELQRRYKRFPELQLRLECTWDMGNHP